MLISGILNSAMTRREARAALKKAGWTFAGGGSFATVYRSPDGSVVAKITKPDRGASRFYRLAMKHQDNPHFPKFAGRIALRGRGSYAYEVESLSRISWEEWSGLKADAGSAYWDAWDLIHEARRKAGLYDDDGDANNMQRSDGTLVITDPLYDENDLSRAYRGRSGSNPDNAGYDEDPDCTDCQEAA